MADTGLKSMGKYGKYGEVWGSIGKYGKEVGAVVSILAAAGVSYTAIVTVRLL